MTNLNIFRAVAFFEGLSFLILLIIGVTLKYAYGMPQTVEVVGPIHGVLFMLYCIYLYVIHRQYNLAVRTTFSGVIAGLLPAGTFFFDGYLRRQVDLS